MADDREPGFYWVKWGFAGNEWSIARWWDEKWLPLYQAVTQQSPGVTDDGMAEIGELVERRLTPAEIAGPEGIVAYDLTKPIAQFPEFRGLFKGWPEPQPITEAQKTGERFLVWYIGERFGPHADESDTKAGWYIARWLDHIWNLDEGPYTDDEPLTLLSEYTTHYLPLPPDVKP